MKFPTILFYVFLSNVCLSHAGWLGWILGKSHKTDKISNEDKFRHRHLPVTSDESVINAIAEIPFELSSADEKFLAEAQKFTDLSLSELDVCQHKLILQLKSECSDLTEEELSKLGVNLLNCQSALEGRKIYPCTSSMTIKDCTKKMDPDTWNAYHLMSNRARSVCYAARQQQFRALTQMAVTKLMSSASQQLGFMKILQKEQEELGSLASQTLGSLTAGQQQLLQQQDYIRASQQQATQQLSSTLRDLSRERAAAISSQRELSSLAELLKLTLEEANKAAAQQNAQASAAQESLVTSLGRVEQRMGEAWFQIESNVEKILSQQQRAAHLHAETLEALARLNSTVSFLLGVAEKSRKQLDWIYDLAANIDTKVGGLSNWLLHGGYLFSGMLLLSFLQAPAVTRMALLFLVPVNLAVQLEKGSGLDAAGLCVLLLFITAAYLLLRGLVHIVNHGREALDHHRAITAGPKTPTRSFEVMEESLSEAEDVQSSFANKSPGNSSFGIINLSESRSSTPLPTPNITSILLDRINDDTLNNTRRRSFRLSSSVLGSPRRDLIPTPSVSINSSRSGTPRILCSGTTVEGKPCRNSSMKNSSFCRFHDK